MNNEMYNYLLSVADKLKVEFTEQQKIIIQESLNTWVEQRLVGYAMVDNNKNVPHGVIYTNIKHVEQVRSWGWKVVPIFY